MTLNSKFTKYCSLYWQLCSRFYCIMFSNIRTAIWPLYGIIFGISTLILNKRNHNRSTYRYALECITCYFTMLWAKLSTYLSIRL